MIHPADLTSLGAHPWPVPGDFPTRFPRDFLESVRAFFSSLFLVTKPDCRNDGWAIIRFAPSQHQQRTSRNAGRHKSRERVPASLLSVFRQSAKFLLRFLGDKSWGGIVTPEWTKAIPPNNPPASLPASQLFVVGTIIFNGYKWKIAPFQALATGRWTAPES